MISDGFRTKWKRTNGTDKMVWTKWYTGKMVLDKMTRTKWYGQNGTDKTVQIKRYR